MDYIPSLVPSSAIKFNSMEELHLRAIWWSRRIIWNQFPSSLKMLIENSPDVHLPQQYFSPRQRLIISFILWALPMKMQPLSQYSYNYLRFYGSLSSWNYVISDEWWTITEVDWLNTGSVGKASSQNPELP